MIKTALKALQGFALAVSLQYFSAPMEPTVVGEMTYMDVGITDTAIGVFSYATSFPVTAPPREPGPDPPGLVLFFLQFIRPVTLGTPEIGSGLYLPKVFQGKPRRSLPAAVDFRSRSG